MKFYLFSTNVWFQENTSNIINILSTDCLSTTLTYLENVRYWKDNRISSFQYLNNAALTFLKLHRNMMHYFPCIHRSNSWKIAVLKSFWIYLFILLRIIIIIFQQTKYGINILFDALAKQIVVLCNLFVKKKLWYFFVKIHKTLLFTIMYLITKGSFKYVISVINLNIL